MYPFLLTLLSGALAVQVNGQYNVHRQDPFALLSGTLLTYQQAACDGQGLDLVCPTGTKISIQLVQYGRTAPSSQVRLGLIFPPKISGCCVMPRQIGCEKERRLQIFPKP